MFEQWKKNYKNDNDNSKLRKVFKIIFGKTSNRFRTLETGNMELFAPTVNGC